MADLSENTTFFKKHSSVASFAKKEGAQPLSFTFRSRYFRRSSEGRDINFQRCCREHSLPELCQSISKPNSPYLRPIKSKSVSYFKRKRLKNRIRLRPHIPTTPKVIYTAGVPVPRGHVLTYLSIPQRYVPRDMFPWDML